MSRPDTYYPDGFRGGSELPDDTEIDQMVFPERKQELGFFGVPPYGMSYNEWQSMQGEREDAYAAECEQRDREFTIEEGNVTGKHPGPPRTP